MNFIKSNIVFFWVGLVIIGSVSAFVLLVKEKGPTTLSKIELNYYEDAQAVTDSINQALDVDFKQNKFFWIGLEPDKIEYLDLAVTLIDKLKNNQTFQKIIIDGELNLKMDSLAKFGFTDVVEVKENLYELGEKLQEFEKNGTAYILVSASIYTNSLLKRNPLHILKDKYKINPLTLSFAYFPTTAQDEKNMTFACRTEDQTGTADWGCVIVNRARFARRKLNEAKLKNWVGLVDSSQNNEYILLFKKTN